MIATTPRERRLAWLAWLAVCLIWGTTYLGIRISLETMPPMLMGGLRWTLAVAISVLASFLFQPVVHAADQIENHLAVPASMLPPG